MRSQAPTSGPKRFSAFPSALTKSKRPHGAPKRFHAFAPTRQRSLAAPLALPRNAGAAAAMRAHRSEG
eukprot:1633578-Pyramimonas_sp.AAC.1